jgi:hypothetical protein
MTTALRRWIEPVSLGCLAACGVCAATVYRGDWTAFGLFLWQLPRLPKGFVVQAQNWTPWVERLAFGYVLLLAAGIFFGLRRIRQNAR